MSDDIIDAQFTSVLSVAIICVKSDNIDDWWTIERAVHEHRQWMQPTEYGAKLMYTGRISDADVEGTSGEMLAIAEAIEKNDSISFRRCSAEYTQAGYVFSSPRNSQEPVLVTHEFAKALAVDIRAKVGARTLEA